MHKACGLMEKIVGETVVERVAAERKGEDGENGTRKVFVWCIWDVIEPCQRKCERCKLEKECAGRAKEGKGFVKVADMLQVHERVGQYTWDAEVLCKRPYPESQVFAAFRKDLHVRAWPGHEQPPVDEPVCVDGKTLRVESVVAGVDFGYLRFVCLWIAMLRDEAGNRTVWVLDEYVGKERSLEENVRAIQARPAFGGLSEAWTPDEVFCDVAGKQRNEHSGETSVDVLKEAGFDAKARAMKVEEGVDRLRGLIHPAGMRTGGDAAAVCESGVPCVAEGVSDVHAGGEWEVHQGWGERSFD